VVGQRLLGQSVELAGLNVARDLLVEAGRSNSANQARNASSSSGGSLATAFSISSMVVMARGFA
jgi:hypothetical protein